MASPGIGRVIMDRDRKTFCVLDKIHGATATIEEGHRQVHKGNLYGISNFFTIASAGVHVYVMSPSVETHVRIAVAVSGNAKFRLCEDVTGLTGLADAGVMFNRNRQRVATGTVAESSIPQTETATGFTGAVEIGLSFLPGGTRNFATGSSNASGDEWVFAAGKIYAIELTNLQAAEMTASINLDVYAPSKDLKK